MCEDENDDDDVESRRKHWKMFHFISHHYLMPRYFTYIVYINLDGRRRKYYRSITYVYDVEKKEK